MTTPRISDLNRIERQITINASRQRVWDLVTRPGWWINDGEIVEHRIERRGDVCDVHDPVHGRYQVRVVAVEPQSYAAFRWRSDGATRDVDGPTTLVEFWIDDDPGGGVTVRVVESGFEELDSTEEVRRANYDGNATGWPTELAALARAVSR
jgi:uncharacterized protein YndB with AHSA1/START domain